MHPGASRPDKSPSLWPREHGAISMLAQPAVCALLIAWRWHWSVAPTLIVAAAMFLIREPFVVLARQKYVWRDPKPETPLARRWILALIPLIALSGALLLLRWQLTWLTAFATGSIALTAYAVWMTVHNRQRSIGLQIASAFGLTSTGLAVSLSLMHSVTTWACWLWLLSAAQAAAGILVVHARLEARIAAKTKKPESVAFFRAAAWMQAALLPLALAAGFLSPWLAAAMLLPAAVHAYELKTLHTPEAMATPLRTIGFRAMGLSIAVSLLLVIGLR
ncbi:MAG: YwiC-like family protein [Acidobacteria bacterium]|nr:YwiC-like family protein [Acidobacteriota bacterium]